MLRDAQEVSAESKRTGGISLCSTILDVGLLMNLFWASHRREGFHASFSLAIF